MRILGSAHIKLPVSIDKGQDGSFDLAGTDLVLSDALGVVVCLVPMPATISDDERAQQIALAEELVALLNRSSPDRPRAASPKQEVDDCQFEQQNTHEWFCTTHQVLMIGSQQEPVFCSKGRQVADGV